MSVIEGKVDLLRSARVLVRGSQPPHVLVAGHAVYVDAVAARSPDDNVAGSWPRTLPSVAHPQQEARTASGWRGGRIQLQLRTICCRRSCRRSKGPNGCHWKRAIFAKRRRTWAN